MVEDGPHCTSRTKGSGDSFLKPSTLHDRTSQTRTDLSLQTDVNAYISGLLEVPTGVKNLADLIQFNIDHADEELIPPFYADQSQSVMYLSFFFVA